MEKSNPVALFISAAYALQINNDDGLVGMGAEVEVLRCLARRVVRELDPITHSEHLVYDFASLTVFVTFGTVSPRTGRGTELWDEIVSQWRTARTKLADLPEVMRLLPLSHDPQPRRPNFTEVRDAADPVESIDVAEEARRAYEAGQLPDPVA